MTIGVGSGIPKAPRPQPPCHRLSYSMSDSYRSTLETKREDKSFDNKAFNNWGLSTCGSYTDDRILSQPSRILQGPPHTYIYICLFIPTIVLPTNTLWTSYVWLIPCLQRHLLTLNVRVQKLLPSKIHSLTLQLNLFSSTLQTGSS